MNGEHKVGDGPRAIPFADRMVRPTTAARMFDISIAGLYSWIESGNFPPPRVYGAGRGCVGWPESELVTMLRQLPLAPGKIGSRRRKAADKAGPR